MSVAKSSGKQTDSRTHQLKNVENLDSDWHPTYFLSLTFTWVGLTLPYVFRAPKLIFCLWGLLSCRIKAPTAGTSCKNFKLDIPHTLLQKHSLSLFSSHLLLLSAKQRPLSSWLPSSPHWLFWGTFGPTDLFLSPASLKESDLAPCALNAGQPAWFRAALAEAKLVL